MTERLAQIDEIRRRLPVSYAEAQQALEEAAGDIVQALVILEARRPADFSALLRVLTDSCCSSDALRWRLEVGGTAVVEQALPAGTPQWLRCLLLLLSVTKVVVEAEGRRPEQPQPHQDVSGA